METPSKPDESIMNAKPQREHRWLHKFIGEWSFEGEAVMAPDEPTEKFHGEEVVRDIGGLWIVAEGTGTCPGDSREGTTLMSIGFDLLKQRYVGTFIASMMACLWVYDGALEQDGTVLSLYADGPDFDEPGKTVKYKDVTEFKSDDHRVLTSYIQGEDGRWQPIMTAHYRRKIKE